MHRRLFLLTPGLVLPALALQAQPPQRPVQVVIGAEDDWYPYSGERQGHAQGVTVDLVKAAFAAVGIEARFELLPYARCMAQTKAGRLLACFNTTRTSLIEADYLWPVRPMFEERFLIYARAEDRAAKNLQVRDLEGQQVAVTRGYEYGSEFDSNSRIQRVVTSRDETNFRMLLRGRARFTLAPEVNTRLLMEQHRELEGRFKVAGQLPLFGLYTAFSRQHPDSAAMLAAFDQGMKLITTNGLASSIQQRWRRP